jgi:NAD(P)-dependent dehydrogenase (short-subunit alcohol dehydrogenase family)
MPTQEAPVRTPRAHNRRAGLTMLALFALALACIAAGANWYLNNARQRRQHETAQSLSVQTATRWRCLTVWSGSLVDQVRTFVSQDWLRLFAAEAAATGRPAADLLQLAAAVEASAMPVEEARKAPLTPGGPGPAPARHPASAARLQ